MALLAWLPLINNIQNNGIANIETSSIGNVTFNNTGKTGVGSFKSGNEGSTTSSDGISINSNFVDDFGDTASVAAWVMPLGDHGHYNGTIVTSGNWNGKKWAFGVSKDNSKVDVLCGNYNTYINCTVPVNEWTHLCSTYDNGVSKLYKNGEYIGELTGAQIKPFESDATNTMIGRATYGKYFGFYGSINDVRIYNHVLSPKEVKEISQGLILHYKLDDDILTGENIMPNNKTMELGSASPSLGRWRLAGTSNMTRTRVEITDSPVGTCYGFQNEGIQTANDGSCYGIDSFPFEPNTIYTIAFYARVTNGTEGYAGYNIYSATYENGSHTKVDKNYRVTPLPSDGSWTRCWLTFKTNGTANRNIYIGITTGDTTVTTQICYVCIWKGLPDFSVYDSSGYGHHGTRVITTDAAIISQEDSRRNSFSTKLNSTLVTHTENGMAYIVGECGLTEPDRLTVAWWMNPLKGYASSGALANGAFSLSNNGMASDYLAAAMNHRDGTIDTNSSDGIHIRPTTAFTLNQWHHYAIVYDGRTATIYKDGEVSSSALFSVTKSLGSFSSVFIGFSRAGSVYRKVNGSYSDFRIYATALSPDDIKELYEVSESIDNFGNVHAYEFVEDGENVSIKKEGIVKALSVDSDPVIWLPLDGNLIDFGSLNSTVSVTGATITSGKFSKAYNFDGSNDYLLGTPAPLNNNSDEWSYACWFKPTVSHRGCLYSNRSVDGNSTGITIFYYESKIYVDDGGRWEPSSKDITVGKWNHVVITRKKGTGKYLYVNGKLSASTSTTNNQTAANATSYLIGMSGANQTVGGNPLNGALCDVRVYSRCLSANEVEQIYAANGFIERGEETSASIGNQYVVSDSFIER